MLLKLIYVMSLKRSARAELNACVESVALNTD